MQRPRNYTPIIVITILFILIVIYLFVSFKQENVECSNKYKYDGAYIEENLITSFSGNKIVGMNLTKTIYLDEKYSDEKHVNYIVNVLKRTLGYLDDVSYSTSNDRIVVKIHATGKDILLLKNIEFNSNDDLEVVVNSNTKSSEVITLSVGDNYTQSELMSKMKNNGYTCR